MRKSQLSELGLFTSFRSHACHSPGPLPEPAANLFLRLCLQNNGRLSKSKRKLPAFAKITPAEMDALEEAISTAYGLQDAASTPAVDPAADVGA